MTFLSSGSLAVIALKQLLLMVPLQALTAAIVAVRPSRAGPRESVTNASAREDSERESADGVGDAWAWGGLADVRDPINGSDRKFIVLRTINTIKNRTTAPPTYR